MALPLTEADAMVARHELQALGEGPRDPDMHAERRATRRAFGGIILFCCVHPAILDAVEPEDVAGGTGDAAGYLAASGAAVLGLTVARVERRAADGAFAVFRAEVGERDGLERGRAAFRVAVEQNDAGRLALAVGARAVLVVPLEILERLGHAEED